MRWIGPINAVYDDVIDKIGAGGIPHRFCHENFCTHPPAMPADWTKYCRSNKTAVLVYLCPNPFTFPLNAFMKVTMLMLLTHCMNT